MYTHLFFSCKSLNKTNKCVFADYAGDTSQMIKSVKIPRFSVKVHTSGSTAAQAADTEPARVVQQVAGTISDFPTHCRHHLPLSHSLSTPSPTFPLIADTVSDFSTHCRYPSTPCSRRRAALTLARPSPNPSQTQTKPYPSPGPKNPGPDPEQGLSPVQTQPEP